MSGHKQQFQLPFSLTRSSPTGEPIRRKSHDVVQASTFRGSGAESRERTESNAPELARVPMAGPTFVAMTDLANLRAAGIVYPSIIHGWRWLYRHRQERGLGDAFRRIGRRIVVDPERYRELVRERPC